MPGRGPNRPPESFSDPEGISSPLVGPRRPSIARRLLPIALLIAAAGVVAGLIPRSPSPYAGRLLPYLYADTRQLVMLVEEAAREVELRGDAAFPEFAVPGSRWFDEARYLADKHPEFENKVPSRTFRDREPHQMVLFEALSLGHQAAQGGAMFLASKM